MKRTLGTRTPAKIPEISDYRAFAILKCIKELKISTPDDVWRSLLDDKRATTVKSTFVQIIWSLYVDRLVRSPVDRNYQLLALEITTLGQKVLDHYERKIEVTS